MPSYLKKRGHTYYVQKRVPAHLRPIIGQDLVTRTTGTTDRKLAGSRRHAILAEFESVFARAAAFVREHPSSPAWVQAVGRQLRHEVEAGERDTQLAGELVLDHIEKHLKAARINPDQLDDAHLSALRAASAMVSDRHFMPLSQAVEAHLAEREPKIRQSSLSAKRRDLLAFADWLESDPNLASIDRRQAGRYVTHLASNGRAEKTNLDTLSVLSAFFRWCIRKGFYEAANPWEGQGVDLKGSRRGDSTKDGRPRAWTETELRRLVDSLPANDIRWQAGVLSLYTGARPSELCDMRAPEVDLDVGYMTIAGGKTENAVRQVPIHPVIRPLVERLAQTTPDGFILPGLKPGGEDRKRSHGLCRRMNYHIRRTLRIADRRLTYYTLRHTFQTALENLQVPQTTTDLIVGHARQGLSYGVYSKGVELDVLGEIVERVSFGGVDDSVARELARWGEVA